MKCPGCLRDRPKEMRCLCGHFFYQMCGSTTPTTPHNKRTVLMFERESLCHVGHFDANSGWWFALELFDDTFPSRGHMMLAQSVSIGSITSWHDLSSVGTGNAIEPTLHPQTKRLVIVVEKLIYRVGYFDRDLGWMIFDQFEDVTKLDNGKSFDSGHRSAKPAANVTGWHEISANLRSTIPIQDPSTDFITKLKAERPKDLVQVAVNKACSLSHAYGFKLAYSRLEKLSLLDPESVTKEQLVKLIKAEARACAEEFKEYSEDE